METQNIDNRGVRAQAHATRVPEFDADAIHAALGDFFNRHNTQFKNVARRQTQLLEMGALTLVAEHYSRGGFTVRPCNLINNEFRIKVGSRGAPWNFSCFEALPSDNNDEDAKIELHANFPVQSAYSRDGGVYVVDVAVIKAGCLPEKPSERREWKSLPNNNLVTFVEAKKLVVYPMLLAQFLGIIHEVKPEYLCPTQETTESTSNSPHFSPALVTIGHLQGTSRAICDGFQQRGFRLVVIPHFDTEIARMRGDKDKPSPFRSDLPMLYEKMGISVSSPPAPEPTVETPN